MGSTTCAPAMMLDERKWAGLLIFVGAAQFVIGVMLAEALYPGYHVGDRFISDLGVGPSAAIFNVSVIFLGLFVLAGAYVARKVFGLILTILIVLTGVGAIGVGVFTENAGILHTIFSLITFLFGGVTAVWAARLLKPPLSYISAIMGAIGLVALGLFISGVFLGLGQGGMERMIAYPIVAWVIAFGGYLMTSPEPALG